MRVRLPAPARRHGGRAEEETVCGLAAFDAAWVGRGASLRRLFFSPAVAPRLGPVCAALARARLPYRAVGDDELARIAGTDRHQGVAGVFAAPAPLTATAAWDALRRRPAPLIVALDGVENPHNLGAIVRTAAHFGVDLVVQRAGPRSAGRSAAAFRVAEGGFEGIAWLQVPSLAEFLLETRRRLAAQLLTTSAEGGRALWACELAQATVWILGEERDGVAVDLARVADSAVVIPGTGLVESLNVSASLAAVLAETARQRRLPGPR